MYTHPGGHLVLFLAACDVGTFIAVHSSRDLGMPTSLANDQIPYDLTRQRQM